MKKYILLGIIAAVMLMPATAFAIGVSATTVITSEGDTNTLNYKDINNNQREQEISNSIPTEVKPVYGFRASSFNAGTSSGSNTTPGVAVTYEYTALNDGNETDTYNLTTTEATYTGGASGWLVQYTSADATTVITALTLAEDATSNFYLKVTPTSDATKAPDASTLTIEAKMATATTPVGTYVGANGTTYGGTSEAKDKTVTTIMAAKMTMSRTATVDSSDDFVAKNPGKLHEAVPGAIITYRITYNNSGSTNAQKVVIADKVPANTKAIHANRTSTTEVAIINGGGQGSASGWTVFYTASSGSVNTIDYDDATSGWTSLSVLTTGTEEINVPSNATYIKWQKDPVENSENETLTWGVVID